MANGDAERCGYEMDIGMAGERVDSDPCDRPLWEDHDRCIWHARVDGKTNEQLAEVDPTSETSIDGAYLAAASLGGVDWFVDTSMVGANLGNADVHGVDFSGANLTMATLTDASGLEANFTDANLEGAYLTNADLRRATLEGVRLHEAILTDVHIGGDTLMGEVTVYEREMAPPRLTDEHPLEAAAWVYRQLRDLYQANALPELARRSYYKEKDARRRLAWREPNLTRALRLEISRWVMAYGGSPYRVLLTSLIVILGFGLLFPLTGGIQESQGQTTITYSLEDPETAPAWWIVEILFKSLYFSVVTFATLGYGDIQPIGTLARLLAGLEAVLGALLSALLVFVLARLVTW